MRLMRSTGVIDLSAALTTRTRYHLTTSCLLLFQGKLSQTDSELGFEVSV